MDGAANAAPLPLLNLMGCNDFLHLPNFGPALGLGLGLELGLELRVGLRVGLGVGVGVGLDSLVHKLEVCIDDGAHVGGLQGFSHLGLGLGLELGLEQGLGLGLDMCFDTNSIRASNSVDDD